ncbi:MAG: hypothetical protein WBP94_17580, partial [Rhodomicrobiaceae bacterium]
RIEPRMTLAEALRGRLGPTGTRIACNRGASEGLATVFRGAVEHQKLARTMKLPDQQFVTFAQTVGYPRA